MITTALRTSAKVAARPLPAARYNPAALFRVAILALGAAAIHFAVVPQHLDEYLPFGIFFLLCGAAQVTLAVTVVLRPGRPVFLAGLAGTLGVLLLWALSRTTGLPIGPEPWTPEQMGMADILASLLEALSLIQLGLLLRGPRPVRRPARRVWRVIRAGGKGLGMVLVLIPVVVLTDFGVRAGLNPMPAAVNMSGPATGAHAIPISNLVAPPGSEPIRRFTLTTAVAQVDGRQVWTYNGTVPGPELRVTEGDRVRVTLINHLPAVTTIHWHGLILPNAEDGVAGLTQDAVPPGHSFTYEFVARDPGTYWYHSHQDTMDQVTRGLYGALVVEPKQGPRYDRDYAVVLGDLGDAVAANGRAGRLALDAKPGELVRLRLINATQTDLNGTPELMTLIGAPYQVVALDGHDLNGPQMLGPAILPVGAGQRYDLALRMPATGQVWLLDTQATTPPWAGPNALPPPGDGLQLLAAIQSAFVGTPSLHNDWLALGSGPTPVVPAAAGLRTFDPTTYGVAAPDPLLARTHFDVDQPVIITNDHGFRDGMFQYTHLLNGETAPNVPPLVVREGQFVRLRFVNDTDEYHPMHLHGHVFTVLSKNGKVPAGSPIHQDTVLVGPRETWEVAFVADNPGLWMLHCHSMVHAAWGLSMMLDYAGYATPYDMGTDSGNMSD